MAQNFILHEDLNHHNHRLHQTSTERIYTSDIAKSYVQQRREKAMKQHEDEKNGASITKLSENRSGTR